MDLVHADLKLENVLVDEMGVCHISNFGMTRSIGEELEQDQSAPQTQTVPRRVRDQSPGIDTRLKILSTFLLTP